MFKLGNFFFRIFLIDDFSKTLILETIAIFENSVP